MGWTLTRLLRWLGGVAATVGLLCAPACGGSASVPKSPEPKAEQVAEPHESTERSDSDTSADCSDATCFKCGQALCLQGFYCDESASVANCQWLAKCGKAGGCGCIQAALGASCTCTERNGGTFVKCS